MKEDIKREFYTSSELMKILGISRPLLAKYIDNGIFTPLKTGGKFIFPRSQIDEFAKATEDKKANGKAAK